MHGMDVGERWTVRIVSGDGGPFPRGRPSGRDGRGTGQHWDGSDIPTAGVPLINLPINEVRVSHYGLRVSVTPPGLPFLPTLEPARYSRAQGASTI